eukprot:m.410250 g.410250  ORF g.410250 m.410250 type:complete len:173 (+) comp16808_c1_seq1:42-560(+)
MNTPIATSLPLKFLKILEENGANVLRECDDMPIYVLGTDEAVEVYKAFLGSDSIVDPLVSVTFGPFANPYVSAAAQTEAWTIIATYQPLLAADFTPEAPAIVLAAPVMAVPMGGGFQSHQAQIALQQVQAKLENPADPAGLPLLTAMNAGDTICDINIVYANCVVTRRIRKL